MFGDYTSDWFRLDFAHNQAGFSLPACRKTQDCYHRAPRRFTRS
jgi:hypothetical protein